MILKIEKKQNQTTLEGFDNNRSLEKEEGEAQEREID